MKLEDLTERKAKCHETGDETDYGGGVDGWWEKTKMERRNNGSEGLRLEEKEWRLFIFLLEGLKAGDFYIFLCRGLGFCTSQR